MMLTFCRNTIVCPMVPCATEATVVEVLGGDAVVVIAIL